MGYRITIRQAARVIHVHVKDKAIDRAHFIHKLVEDEAKTRGKLAAMEGGNLTARHCVLATMPSRQRIGTSRSFSMPMRRRSTDSNTRAVRALWPRKY